MNRRDHVVECHEDHLARRPCLPRQARRYLAALAACVMASPAAAQTRHEFYFYHGNPTDRSSALQGGPQGYSRDDRRRLEITARANDSVCVNVVNAHPVNYGYSLTAVVDTSGPKLPDLSKQETLLAALLKLPERRADLPPGVRPADVPSLGPIRWFIERLDTLAVELDTARGFATASDLPEGLGNLETPAAALRAGFRSAQHKLTQGFSTGAGHFGDPRLAERIRAWGDSASKLAASEPVLRSVALALTAYGGSLVSERDQLRGAYGKARSLVSACGKVGTGTTTFTFQIAPKDSSKARRDTGKEINLTVEAKPRFQRTLVSLNPIAFAAGARDVPEFQVVNGTLIGPTSDQVAFRVGAMLTFNLANFGPQDDFGAGFGLATAMSTSGRLTDIFVSGLVSYLEALRIGVGVGWSEFPKSVKGATVGAPFPTNAKLEDLIEQERKLALQIVFVLPGFKLK
jgi:hypothetical protein